MDRPNDAKAVEIAPMAIKAFTLNAVIEITGHDRADVSRSSLLVVVFRF